MATIAVKTCGGPYHRGQPVALSEFAPRRYPSGRVGQQPWCRVCQKHHRHKVKHPHRGYVPLDRVWFVFEELVRRLGHVEAARRMGIDRGALTKIRNQERRHVTKLVALKAIQTLRTCREQNLFRERNDIISGAHRQGRPEPTSTEKPEPPLTTEQRQEWRRRELRSERLHRAA